MGSMVMGFRIVNLILLEGPCLPSPSPTSFWDLNFIPFELDLLPIEFFITFANGEYLLMSSLLVNVNLIVFKQLGWCWKLNASYQI